MSLSKSRRQIANQAARLMYSRQESEYFEAKRKAARMLGLGRVKPSDLPSNAEIRDEVATLTRIFEVSDAGTLKTMRLHALWWLRELKDFHPKLIGSVRAGNVRQGSDIDIHLFSNHPTSIESRIDEMGWAHQLERKRLKKDGQLRVFTHIHVDAEFPVELTVYGLKDLGTKFRSSIDGKPIQGATEDELARLIALEHGEDQASIEQCLESTQASCDPTIVFQALLLPLEKVIGSPEYHPEGDTLYHSLQVFDLARQTHAYDEEFLLAALLHDVGKAIDPYDHVAAGLDALDGFITERTHWLIEHHMEAHKIRDRTIGARARRRLSSHPWFQDLMDLNECDRDGRTCGVEVPSVEEAIDYIESLGDRFG